MTDREMKRLKRTELLEMLVALSEENETLTAQNAALQQQLDDKTLNLQNAGSIAEAALAVNHVLADAQAAAQQYLDNLQRLDAAAQAKADALLEQTQRQCDAKLADANREIDAMWAQLRNKVDAYARQHGVAASGKGAAQ